VYGGPHVVATMLSQGAADIVRGDVIVSGGITPLSYDRISELRVDGSPFL
jgi:hypothetical protein